MILAVAVEAGARVVELTSFEEEEELEELEEVVPNTFPRSR